MQYSALLLLLPFLLNVVSAAPGKDQGSARPPTPNNPKKTSQGHEVFYNPEDNAVHMNMDPKTAPSHADSIHAAEKAGTQMQGLTPATAEQHKDYTNYMKKQPSAGEGKVREDEPPRAAALNKPDDRHIQGANAKESPGQGVAVKAQKKVATDQQTQGNQDVKLSYGVKGEPAKKPSPPPSPKSRRDLVARKAIAEAYAAAEAYANAYLEARAYADSLVESERLHRRGAYAEPEAMPVYHDLYARGMPSYVY